MNLKVIKYILITTFNMEHATKPSYADIVNRNTAPIPKQLDNHIEKNDNSCDGSECCMNNDNICSICYEPLAEGCNKATIDCGHSFHYKCIFKWNTKSSGGECCPLCRSDMDLPEPVYSSSESEDSDSDFETESDSEDSNLSDDSHSEDEEEARIRNEVILNKQRRALQFFIKSSSSLENTIEISCKKCKKTVHHCDFCSQLICSCKNDEQKMIIKVNPFNKLYNSCDDGNSKDTTFYEMFNIDISGVDDEELRIGHICHNCFTSRDYILWATLRHINEEYGSTNILRPEAFDNEDIQMVFYNLFYDDSGIDNTALYSPYPNFQTFAEFKEYGLNKFNSTSLEDIVQVMVDEQMELLE